MNYSEENEWNNEYERSNYSASILDSHGCQALKWHRISSTENCSSTVLGIKPA